MSFDGEHQTFRALSLREEEDAPPEKTAPEPKLRASKIYDQMALPF